MDNNMIYIFFLSTR